jgi:hypothetical protein
VDLSGVLVSECGSPDLYLFIVSRFWNNMHVKGQVQCTTAYYSNKCIYEKKGDAGRSMIDLIHSAVSGNKLGPK